MATNRAQFSRVMLIVERELLALAHLRDLLTTASTATDRHRKKRRRVKSRIKQTRPKRRAISTGNGRR
jgi:hypothetical protein